jgi:hypothetical protein
MQIKGSRYTIFGTHHPSKLPISSIGKGIKSKVLVCDSLHSVGQNHFYVMLLFKGILFIF